MTDTWGHDRRCAIMGCRQPIHRRNEGNRYCIMHQDSTEARLERARDDLKNGLSLVEAAGRAGMISRDLDYLLWTRLGSSE